MRLQALRGAITCTEDSKAEIDAKTARLVKELFARNELTQDDVVSVLFTSTPDLTAEFPALAAREKFGWTQVALMCGHEMNVPGSLPMCLRILLHVNTDRSASEIKFVYLRGARALRGDVTDE